MGKQARKATHCALQGRQAFIVFIFCIDVLNLRLKYKGLFKGRRSQAGSPPPSGHPWPIHIKYNHPSPKQNMDQSVATLIET